MFTAENTHGFSAADLALLNAALETLMARDSSIDEKSASDIINNNWRETGNTVESLVKR